MAYCLHLQYCQQSVLTNVEVIALVIVIVICLYLLRELLLIISPPATDYIRTFTWDKKLEMVVKSTGILGGQGEQNFCSVYSLNCSHYLPYQLTCNKWILQKK